MAPAHRLILSGKNFVLHLNAFHMRCRIMLSFVVLVAAAAAALQGCSKPAQDKQYCLARD